MSIGVDDVKKASRIAFVGFEFLCWSFIGWLYEITLTLIAYGRYEDRGMLHLPFCPIYGFCGLIVLLTLGRIENKALFFAASTVMITVIEYAVSYILDKCFNLWLWDYFGWKFNLNGRVALGSSLIFGALSLLMIKVLHPCADKIYAKLPEWAAFAVGILSVGLLLGDFLLIVL